MKVWKRQGSPSEVRDHATYAKQRKSWLGVVLAKCRWVASFGYAPEFIGPIGTSGEVSHCAASSIAGSAWVPLLSGKARHAAVEADELQQQQDDDEGANGEDRNASRHLRRDCAGSH